MSLHLGSSKYDEHTVRKGISNWHFDHQVSKGVSIPCALSASQVTVKYICCHASLGDKAAEPRHVMSRLSVLPSKCSFPSLYPARGARLCTAPRSHRVSIPGWCAAGPPRNAGMSHRGPDQHTTGDAASSGQGRMGLALIASAGEASKAGSEVSVAWHEQPRCTR